MGIDGAMVYEIITLFTGKKFVLKGSAIAVKRYPKITVKCELQMSYLSKRKVL